MVRISEKPGDSQILRGESSGGAVLTESHWENVKGNNAKGNCHTGKVGEAQFKRKMLIVARKGKKRSSGKMLHGKYLRKVFRRYNVQGKRRK